MEDLARRCVRCGAEFHYLDLVVEQNGLRAHYVRCPVTIEGGSAHYKAGKVEPLELIEAQGLGFHLGNVVKYVVRAHYYDGQSLIDEGKKMRNEAIDKAIWYLMRFREIHK